MKNFKESYKEAVDSIQVPLITAKDVMKDDCQRKKRIYRRHRKLMFVATAASLFILLTAGAAAAKGYARSVIKTDEYGFKTADAKTAYLSEQENIPDTEGYSEEEYSGGAQGSGCGEVEQLETKIMPQTEYRSLDEFREAQQTPIALPDTNLLGETIISEHYYVVGERLLKARIEIAGRLFMLDQMYFGDTHGHASSTMYPEGVCNERSYTTIQGYTYTVIDSVCEEGKSPDIHAAISIGDYELIANFTGYTQEEAYEILDSMDLTVYLNE